ncbi:G-protein coupled receptor Mth2 [Diachasma alloeum]|uniref:G-protein coupled receptor Mth2 n=1 Tax=Diachasma alloeum TaxID=454923 RepID=UPI00073834C2|nr:G-protein coupled receptor Mth2 [Diachasma alloeum]
MYFNRRCMKNRLSAEIVRTNSHCSVICFYLLVYLIDRCASGSSDLTSDAHPTIYQISINESNAPQYRGLPVVQKCCPVGEVLTKDDTGRTVCLNASLTLDSTIFSPYFSDFNRTGVLAPGDEKSQFVAIIGDPCQFKKYMLEPEVTSDDEHYLLLNGSIFGPHHMPSMLSPGRDYCMEVIPDLGLRTLVCFQEEEQKKAGDFRLTFYACGLLISVPFLILTIIAYCITPRLMDVHGKALCHYCGCLAVAFAALAITQLSSNHLYDEMCISTAFVIQFSFVACFFWLNVMCIETYLLARRYMDSGCSTARQPHRLFFYYSLWAWTPPAILIIVSMIMDLSPTVPMTYIKPNFGSQSCWFESDVEAMPYFYVPVGLLLIANIVLFTMTAVAITHHQRDLDLRRLRQDRETNRDERRTLSRLKRLFLVCLSLFFLMGMNWAMEMISWWAGGDPLAWSAFDLVNALQGILVFGIFVLRKPIRQLVWYEVQKIRGVEATEPEVASMDRSLLTVLNIDALPSTERML